jgi:hypothetical protein
MSSPPLYRRKTGVREPAVIDGNSSEEESAWVQKEAPSKAVKILRLTRHPSVFQTIVEGKFSELETPYLKGWRTKLSPQEWLEIVEFALDSKSVHHIEFLCHHGPAPLFHSYFSFIFGFHLLTLPNALCLQLFTSKLGPRLSRDYQGEEAWPGFIPDQLADTLDPFFTHVNDEPSLVFVLSCLLRLDPPLTSDELNALFVKAARLHAWHLAFGLVALGANERLSIRLSDELVYALEEGDEPVLYTFWHLLGQGVYEEGLDEAGVEEVYHDLFTTACQDGLNATVVWMAGTGKVDPSKNDYECFVNACWHGGGFWVAKWLANEFDLSETAKHRAYEDSNCEEIQEWLVGTLGGFFSDEWPEKYKTLYMNRLLNMWTSLCFIKIWFAKCHRRKCEGWYGPNGMFGKQVIQRLIDTKIK